MSIILKLLPNLSNLGDVLDVYTDILHGAEDDLMITGKTLHDANRDQPLHMSYYGQRLVEVKTIRKYVDARVDQVRGTLWVGYKERHSVALGTRDIDQYVNKEDSYVAMSDMSIITSELLNQFEMLLEAFKSRGYALRNITESRIAEVQDFIL